jgi:stearoyl-CoA desaturase (delta-9 desaturase)
VQRGQLDTSARLIWIFERFGWVYDVRWPTEQRLARLAVGKD